jgi:hypothetical protein
VRDFRAGTREFFVSGRPGPKTAPGKDAARPRIIELRAAGHSIDEIAQALAAEGTPLNRTGIAEVIAAEGLPRLWRRPDAERGGPAREIQARAEAADFAALPGRADTRLAGLFLAIPDLVALGIGDLVAAAGYPSTPRIPALSYILSLLALKLTSTRRVSHVYDIAADPGAALFAGLTALPKATALTTYSYRLEHSRQAAFLTALDKAAIAAGLAQGEALNLDFHAVMHWGQDPVLEKHYVPRRSQRTRAVLTFFAQDHASSEMVYANADITKAEQAAEIIAFADYWNNATGFDPGLLVFDSQLTTYKILDELTGRGINWLTLRQRGKSELGRLAALPASAWKTVTVSRSGRYRRPRLHEDMIKLKEVSAKVRQIAVKNIGRNEPTLLITHDLATPARDLFARYAERMLVENELDAYIGGFHLDALTSGVPLNVDLDTTLTVIAGNLYRLLALKLDRYANATPEKIWRHFLDATGTLHIGPDAVTCALNLRSHHPVLIDAGFADLQVPIPWWDDRTLRFRFPPR